VDDGVAVEFIHGFHDAILEFLFRRDTEMAQHRAGQFGEETFDEIEPGAVCRCEGERKAASRLFGEPSLGLFGDVRGMIVEDQLDCRVGRIGGVEKLEEVDEFAAAVAIPDQGVNLSGEQIDAGQQADGAFALAFMIACKGRMNAGLGRQVRCRGGERLDTGLLVIGDDCHAIAGLLVGGGRGLLDELDLAIDAQNLRHLAFEFGIAALQVVAHFVRLDLLRVENVAQRALNELAKAGVARRRSMLAHMAGEQTRRPQFVRIAKFLGLAAGEIHHPRLGFGGDCRLPSWARQIVKRRDRTIGERPLNAAPDRLVMHTHGLPGRKKRRVVVIGQQHSRPFDPSRRLGSRSPNHAQYRQIRLADRQFHRLPPRRHDINPRCESSNKATSYAGQNESQPYDWFHGIDVLDRQ
jgi:hypothetical protein